MNHVLVCRALHFASRRHTDQRRKGLRAEPYINHLIEVVWLLTEYAEIDDAILLSAAVLHDVVEDTGTELSEIQREFGLEIAEIVEAVTDDKSLPSEERKRLQELHMRNASPEVRLLKLADHCSNVASLPESWTLERCHGYLDWSSRVTDHCFGIRTKLDGEYHRRAGKSRRILEER